MNSEKELNCDNRPTAEVSVAGSMVVGAGAVTGFVLAAAEPAGVVVTVGSWLSGADVGAPNDAYCAK